jgi:hypothetical protein
MKGFEEVSYRFGDALEIGRGINWIGIVFTHPIWMDVDIGSDSDTASLQLTPSIMLPHVAKHGSTPKTPS